MRSNLIFHIDGSPDPLVADAVRRYQGTPEKPGILFPHRAAAGSEGIGVVAISVAAGGNKSEGYRLVMNATRVKVAAESPVGALRALETLSQLFAFDFDSGRYLTQPVVPLEIEDRPRFEHRGLMIDSSRHFLPVALIKRTIRAMSFAKLNVLHWHLVDAQAFPMISRAAPELAQRGAWSPGERYTPEDIQDVVRFAADHGVLVVPELDMPGHTKSWARAHPEVFPSTDFSQNDVGALDPAKDETYALVDGLLRDVLRGDGSAGPKGPFFPGPLVHLGGDEVPYDEWSNPGDQKFMAARHMERADDLFAYFLSRVGATAKGLGKRIILWEEAFQHGNVPNSTIIQVWLNRGLAREAASQGYDFLLSQGWYLDWANLRWEDVYDNDPARGLSRAEAKHALGGEACMWGETVDAGDFEQTVWPRLAAVAERLWSPSGEATPSAEAARPRLERFRCLLLGRGVGSTEVGASFRSAPTGPGSC